jgi:serine/threonine-protein kinase
VRTCTTCQRQFEPDHRFCPFDGAPLRGLAVPPGTRHCPRCHREYDADHGFCIHDGAQLSAQPSEGSAELRGTKLSYTVLGGRYLIRGFIGKGATARVYLAEDLDAGRPVAVKVLDDTFARVRGSRDRFLREASAAAKIGHPNVVDIFDTGQRADGAPYLVMEFIFGESLGDRLRREHTLSRHVVIDVMLKAARGLEAAHQAGIVHRDVKPDNIFLVGEPGSLHAVKVLDFGMARIKELPSLTAFGTAVGTMEYMAPEQVVTELTDDRTDVYGLGVALYRAITGRLPFSANEDARLLAAAARRGAGPAVLAAPRGRSRPRGGGAARAAQTAGEPLSHHGRVRRRSGAAGGPEDRRSPGPAAARARARHLSTVTLVRARRGELFLPPARP